MSISPFFSRIEHQGAFCKKRTKREMSWKGIYARERTYSGWKWYFPAKPSTVYFVSILETEALERAAMKTGQQTGQTPVLYLMDSHLPSRNSPRCPFVIVTISGQMINRPSQNFAKKTSAHPVTSSSHRCFSRLWWYLPQGKQPGAPRTSGSNGGGEGLMIGNARRIYIYIYINQSCLSP